MKRIYFPLALSTGLLLPTVAFAYVGPGAGLSLLGALWALLAAVFMAVSLVVAWPLRRMLRRRRAGNAPADANDSPKAAEPVGSPRAKRDS